MGRTRWPYIQCPFVHRRHLDLRCRRLEEKSSITQCMSGYSRLDIRRELEVTRPLLIL